MIEGATYQNREDNSIPHTKGLPAETHDKSKGLW